MKTKTRTPKFIHTQILCLPGKLAKLKEYYLKAKQHSQKTSVIIFS